MDDRSLFQGAFFMTPCFDMRTLLHFVMCTIHSSDKARQATQIATILCFSFFFENVSEMSNLGHNFQLSCMRLVLAGSHDMVA